MHLILGVLMALLFLKTHYILYFCSKIFMNEMIQFWDYFPSLHVRLSRWVYKIPHELMIVGIKIAGRNINNLRYADDTTLMAESEEELKSFLMKVKVEICA